MNFLHLVLLQIRKALSLTALFIFLHELFRKSFIFGVHFFIKQFCLMLSELAPRRECLLEERISGFCLDHLALLANSKVPRSFE
jgi:hypothetical protein